MSKIDLMPNELRWYPPTDKYSISGLLWLSCIITVEANLKGLVLKANQNIFLDKKKSIIFANKNKIFITIK